LVDARFDHAAKQELVGGTSKGLPTIVEVVGLLADENQSSMHITLAEVGLRCVLPQRTPMTIVGDFAESPEGAAFEEVHSGERFRSGNVSAWV
jgi:hypothetical protein